MNQTLFTLAIMLSIATISCNSNSLNGIYVCDASQKKADTTIRHETYDESTMDLTCAISELNFKGNSTVLIKVAKNEVTTSYVIDKEYLRIKGDKGDMLFKIADEKTLIAEGFPPGTYHKK